MAGEFEAKTEVARHLLAGLTTRESAEGLGMGEGEIVALRGSTEVRAVVQSVRDITDAQIKEVGDNLAKLAVMAIAAIEEILGDPEKPAAVRSRTAIEVLKLSGHAAPTRYMGVTAHFGDGELLEELKRRATGAGMMTIEAHATRVLSETGEGDGGNVN